MAKYLLHPSVDEERRKCKLKRLVHLLNSYFIVHFSLQPWLDDYAKNRHNKSRFQWIANISHIDTVVDAAIIFMFAKYMRRNICVVPTAGDPTWRALPDHDDDYVIVAWGDKFLPTHVGIYHFLPLSGAVCVQIESVQFWIRF